MEIRTKEAIVQLTLSGVRLGGSFTRIKDVSIKPDVDMTKKRFTGQKRHSGDLDVKGYDFSFKVEKSDHVWWQVWKKFEQAELAGTEFPELTIAVTYQYRGRGAQLKTVTLHTDLVMKPDEDALGNDAYQEVSMSGTCGYCSGAD